MNSDSLASEIVATDSLVADSVASAVTASDSSVADSTVASVGQIGGWLSWPDLSIGEIVGILALIATVVIYLLQRRDSKKTPPLVPVLVPQPPPPIEEPEPLPPTFAVPHRRNQYFTGRDEIIERLHDALHAEGAAALAQAISGLGGIGKTQTAVEYAYRYGGEYDHVLWVRAETETDLANGFGEIARLLNLPERDGEPDAIRAAVKRWLETNERWLLVFDNADMPALLDEYLPNRHAGHVIVTSRAQSFDRLGIREPVSLPVLPPEDALDLLFARSGCDRGNAGELAAAEQLADELGRLPLALEQAGACIKATDSMTIASYLKSYRALDLLDRYTAEVGDYEVPVTKTWLLNFEAVEAESPAAADLLRTSAFLAPDDIPFEVFVEGAEHLGTRLQDALADSETASARLGELLGLLSRYSLVACKRNAATFSVHRLVQDVLRRGMEEEMRWRLAIRTVHALNAAFPGDKDIRTWPSCDRLVSHVLAVSPFIGSLHIETEGAARLLNRAGHYLYERARYEEAEPLYDRALAIDRKAYGEDHPEVAVDLNNLAGLYSKQGRLAEAKLLYERSLAIREKEFGPDHAATGITVGNLAGVYEYLGRFDDAEPLHVRALAIHEKALDENHPDVAISLDNLAGFYLRQGRYREARPLYERALAIWEYAVGPDHPDTAACLSDLAPLYDSQGRHAEAESLLKRALAIREKALGPDHPDTAKSLTNLAGMYCSLDHPTDAQPLLERALGILGRSAGPKSPDTAFVRTTLGLCLVDQERHAEAEPHYREAVDVLLDRLGAGHGWSQTAVISLAKTLVKLGRKDEARALVERVEGMLDAEKRGDEEE